MGERSVLELVLECLATDFPPRDVLQADLVCHAWTHANANGGWRGVARAFGLQPRHKEAAQSWRDALRAVVAPVYRVLQPQADLFEERAYLQSRVEWARQDFDVAFSRQQEAPSDILATQTEQARVRLAMIHLRPRLLSSLCARRDLPRRKRPCNATLTRAGVRCPKGLSVCGRTSPSCRRRWWGSCAVWRTCAGRR